MKEENIKYWLETFYYPLIDKWAANPADMDPKNFFSGITSDLDGKGLGMEDYLERKELLKRLKCYAQNKGLTAYYGEKKWETRVLYVTEKG